MHPHRVYFSVYAVAHSRETLAKMAAIKKSGAKHLLEAANSDDEDTGEDGQEREQQLLENALKSYRQVLASSEQLTAGMHAINYILV